MNLTDIHSAFHSMAVEYAFYVPLNAYSTAIEWNDTLNEPNRHTQCIPFNGSRICIQGHIEPSPGWITQYVTKHVLANLRRLK